MKTLRERFIAALIAAGEREVPSKSRKFVTLTRKSGGFWFIGRAGSLRYGQRSSASFAASAAFKNLLIASLTSPPPARESEAGPLVQKMEEPPC